MAYLTKEIFKSDWIDKASAQTDADALIGRLIDSVSAEIKSICNQPIEAEAVTLYFAGNGKATKRLNYTVPLTYTSLAYRDDPTDSWTSITSGVTLYTQDGLWYLWNDDTYASPFYKAVITAGYATADVPDDVVNVGYQMMKDLWYLLPFAAQGERFGVASITEAQAGVTFGKGLLDMRPRFERLLMPYRWCPL